MINDLDWYSNRIDSLIKMNLLEEMKSLQNSIILPKECPKCGKLVMSWIHVEKCNGLK